MRTEPQDDIFRLLEENVAISKKILANTEKTRKAMFWMNVSTWVRTLVWIVPLILAAVYLPRLVSVLEQRIQSFTNPGGGQFQGLLEQFQNSPEVNQYVEEFRKRK